MSRSFAPPGVTERPRARRALVLAPHYDDEVLGCGGLLSLLAEDGCEIHTLFLTDSGGGVEGTPDSRGDSDDSESSVGSSEADPEPAYGHRRRREARAAAPVLGIDQIHHLDLPDGQLEQHLGEAIEAIRIRLASFLPDLVLVPSPLETTPDHRAAFAALFELLHPLRDAASSDLRVLAYEVNHPAYPDLLVDVSDRLEVLERAMTCYASQQDRHDYLAAAIGLRRYRAHSLPPDVRAAEGYVALEPADFESRSLAALIEHLGGSRPRHQVSEGPLVSVIVRTKDRPQLLREALDSLAASSYRRLEVVLVNDGGTMPSVPSDHPFVVRQIDLPTSRGRAGAANVGIEEATGSLVGFLDDDDLVFPEHYATLVDALSAASVRVAYTDAAVAAYELVAGEALDGRGPSGWTCVERRVPYSRDFDPDLLLLDNYIPFHTVLVERSLLREVGPIDEQFAIFEDWDFLIRLAQQAPFHHVGRVTCEYRHFRKSGHHVLGSHDRVDGDRAFLDTKAAVLSKHAALLDPELVARTVAGLRREAVEAAEEVDRARRETRAVRSELGDALEATREERDSQARQRERAQQRLFAVEEERDRLNGQVESLDRDRAALHADLVEAGVRLQKLLDDELQMRKVIDEQTDHLGRTYAEIERLNQLLADMRGTRAWRLHQMLHRGDS